MSVCSDGPNMDGVNAAAAANAELGKEALQWYRERDAREAPLRDQAARTAIEVANAQLDSMRSNTELANEYADYQRTTFRPLEQGIVADAESYDTPAKRQAAAEAAMADVNKGFSTQRSAASRRLAAEGIDAGSMRAMTAQTGMDVDQALGQAGAAYKARQGVETQGFARRMDAASLGRGLASSQATSAGVALNAGNSAATNASQPVNNSQRATGTYGAGFGTAISGNSSAGNLYGQAAAASGSDDGLWGALGNVAGQFAGSSAGSEAIKSWLPSDENLKEGIEPVDEDAALEQVISTPVSEWRYAPAKMAERGIEVPVGMEGKNTGAMAQDVKRTMGEEASDGTKVNLVSLVGKSMAAVKALDRRVSSIAAMLQGGQLEAGAA
jgi:hypothetical protein